MKVRFSMTALLYLLSEQTYIARFNKRAARAVSQQIKDTARMLASHPMVGTSNPSAADVRRYVSAPYHMDYIIDDGTVIIIAIRHGRQQEPDIDMIDGDFNQPDDDGS